MLFIFRWKKSTLFAMVVMNELSNETYTYMEDIFKHSDQSTQ